jgi:hypoxanthine phosphoribosyltransferase
MKIKKKDIIIWILVFIIFLYHFCILNGLEKNFNQMYFSYDDVKRPLDKCKNDENKSLACIGMPSGHAEIITIMSLLLYHYKYINQWICVVFIIIGSLQRIVTNMHTFPQIIMGIILGTFYSMIYIYFDLSIWAFLIVLGIGFILLNLIFYKIDKEVKGQIPDWVDKNMYADIYKKQNTHYYFKISSILFNSLYHESILFCNWRMIEKYLDSLIDKIRERIDKEGIQFDAIVGIKTGGAILCDYIAGKVGMKNYKIKMTRNSYHCDKNTNNSVYESILKKYSDYIICEGIYDNLEGKNIIVIDECIDSGNTMNECIKYLKNDKGANIVYPMSIAITQIKYNENRYIEHVNKEGIIIWAWGYEN